MCTAADAAPRATRHMPACKPVCLFFARRERKMSLPTACSQTEIPSRIADMKRRFRLRQVTVSDLKTTRMQLEVKIAYMMKEEESNDGIIAAMRQAQQLVT